MNLWPLSFVHAVLFLLQVHAESMHVPDGNQVGDEGPKPGERVNGQLLFGCTGHVLLIVFVLFIIQS